MKLPKSTATLPAIHEYATGAEAAEIGFRITRERELTHEEILTNHQKALAKYSSKYGAVKIYYDDVPSKDHPSIQDMVIETRSLEIRPITFGALDAPIEAEGNATLRQALYDKLYSDQDVMSMFGDGALLPHEAVNERLDLNATKWKDHYVLASMYGILKDSAQVMGVVGAFESSELVPQISGFSAKEFQGRGCGSEALGALILAFLPCVLQSETLNHFNTSYTMTDGHFMKDDSHTLSMTRIIATARKDNFPSLGCINGYGFTQYAESIKYGAERVHCDKILVAESLCPYNADIFGVPSDYYSDGVLG